MTMLQSFTGKWFTPKSEEGKKKPSQFKIKPLTPVEAAEIWDEYGEDKELKLNMAGYIDTAQKCIIDWKFVKDENGKEVDFDEKLILRLSYNLLVLIAIEVQKMGEMSEDETKN